MGRRKIEIKPIKDDRNRSVTFLKRKGGLFKKAHELSVLCSVDVAVVIFGSNKKLYQYSSGDINEIISRHSYYEAAHESKGPADFAGKKDLGDDDDEDEAVPEVPRAGSHSSNDHPLPAHMLHLSNRPTTASASPPNMHKGINGAPGYPMGPRVGTPQPMTRPSSRNQMQRRNSSNLVPPNAYPATQPPSHPSNAAYAYIQQHQQPPVYGGQMMQPAMNQMGTYSHPQYAAPPQPHHQSQTEAQARAEAYINETRRQSMPTSFHQEQPVSENEPPQRPDPPAPQPVEPKRAPAKSRSMFTPIGPSESMLAQHFGFGQSQETGRSHSVDVGAVQRRNAEMAKAEEKPATVAPPAPIAPPPLQTISASPPPVSRTNSLTDPKSAGMRPKLKVRIPSEHSDAGSAAGSSPRESTDTAGNLSARPGGEGGPVVLPPPSPSHSVGALLSAGATGPTNPFSRPPPTSTQPEQTPMSALPSRFTEAMLPSPSQFYGGDWMNMPFPGPRGGPNGDNMLPSPLNFQTPVGGSSAPFFKQEPDTNNKRRSPDSEQNEASAAKRQKNS